MATARAILTGVGGIHRHKLSTGAYCLVRKEAGELTPRGVMNALGKTVGVHHAIDRQILHRDEIKRIDDATTVLMGEITTPPGNAFMDSRDYLPVFGALRRAFLQRTVRALRLRQRLFLAAKEVGIGDFLTCRECGEGLQT